MLQWITALEKIAATSHYVSKSRFGSFAPIRMNVAAQWLVDGVSLLHDVLAVYRLLVLDDSETTSGISPVLSFLHAKLSIFMIGGYRLVRTMYAHKSAPLVSVIYPQSFR
jgi:hypothetical protein